MNRNEKIALLQKRMRGERIDPTDLYSFNAAFLKSGNEYFNDGYRWTAQEFEALQQKLTTPPWIPGVWFIEVDEHIALCEWLQENTKPISQRIPGAVEQCTRSFDDRLQEFGSDGVYYF